jgi:TetR/AcrR family transcriptional regulator, transcriptional repressor for nem operon
MSIIIVSIAKLVLMRKSNEEAARTRARIVAAAASKFRADGIAATGLNGLMASAGLTHGGFYKHFASKDQLVEEACAFAMRTTLKSTVDHARVVGPKALRSFIAAYLSPEHRDNPGDGCSFTALGAEIGRAHGAVRAIATMGFRDIAEALADLDIRLRTDGGARARVMAATLVGALVCARAVGDAELSDAILRETQASLLSGLDADETTEVESSG